MTEQKYGKYKNPVSNFFDLGNARKEAIMVADGEIDTYDPMLELAKQLHPNYLKLVIADVIEEGPGLRSYVFKLDEDSDLDVLPNFRPGQYLSFKLDEGDSVYTRPYSLCSSPREATRKGFYKVTIKEKEDGFFTPKAFKNWTKGTKVISSGPQGDFYHTILRDKKEVVCLAGGTGIAPFSSMAKDIIQRDLDLRLRVLYGVETADEIIEKDFWDKVEEASDGKVKVTYIIHHPDKGEEVPGAEEGLITRELIEKDLPEDPSFFICGPIGFYPVMEKILQDMGVDHKRIRQEINGEVDDIRVFDEYDATKYDQTFTLTVHRGVSEIPVEAAAKDSLLVTLEKNGFFAPSSCRTGNCGACRMKILSGDLFVRPDSDGRRVADKDFGYFHTCATYPLSDVHLILTEAKPGI